MRKGFTSRPHLVPSVVSVLMLMLALLDWPYGYYILLRFIVCGSAVFIALLSYEAEKQWLMWIAIFAALLFNPFIRVHLDREVWAVIDVVCAILFLFPIFKLTVKGNAE